MGNNGRRLFVSAWQTSSDAFTLTILELTEHSSRKYFHRACKYLNFEILNAEEAVYDVDVINFFLDAFGSFSLLAASAATYKFLSLKSAPGNTVKKTA